VTDATKKQLFTFTTKNGPKFVPHLAPAAPLSKGGRPPLTKTYARKPRTKDTAKPQDTLTPVYSTNTVTVAVKDTSATNSTTGFVVAPSSHVPTTSKVMATTNTMVYLSDNTMVGLSDTTNTIVGLSDTTTTIPKQPSTNAMIVANPTVQAPDSPATYFATVMNDEVSINTCPEEFIMDLEVATIQHMEEVDTMMVDEGYNTAESTASGKSSPTSSIGDDVVTLNNHDQDHTVEWSLPADFNINAIDIDFVLQQTEVANAVDGILPDHQEFNFIGTYETTEEMNKALDLEPKQDAPKERRRHKLGPKQQKLEELPRENIDNVKRCREYRKNKNIKLSVEEEELKELEERNAELREKEKMMVEKLSKAQGAYIRLIREGRVKFA